MDISMEARTARATALAKLMAGGTLVVRPGPRPAGCEAPGVGSTIVSFAIPNNVLVRGGAIEVFGEPVRAIVSAPGLPGFWRVEKGGKCVLQGDMAEDFPQMSGDMLPQGYMVELRSWSLSDMTVSEMADV